MDIRKRFTRASLLTLFRRTWVRVLLVFFLLGALFLVLLPLGIKKGLQYWLLRNGAEKVLIDRLTINPFLGRVGIGNVQVESTGKSVLTQARLDLDLSLTALLKKTIRIKKATYDKVHIDIEQRKDGRWRFTSYTTGPPPETPPQAEIPSSWHFLADEMAFTDCDVHLKTPQLELNLTVGSAELKKFSTLPGGDAGSFTFKGTVNDAPVEIFLEKITITPQIDLTGTIKANGLHLDQFAPLLNNPAAQPFSATFSADGRFSFALKPSAGPVLGYDGSLNLADFAVGGFGPVVRGKNLSWQGHLAFDGQDSAAMSLDLNGALHGQAIAAAQPDGAFSAKGTEVQLQGPLKLNLLADHLNITSEAALSLSEATVSLPSADVALAELQWQGNLSYSDSKQAGQQAKITTEGTLKTTAIGYEQPQQHLHFSQQQLEVRGKTETEMGDTMHAAFTGSSQSKGIDLQTEAFTLGNKDISWNGTIGYAAAQNSAITLDGQLKSGESSLTLPEQQFRLEQGGFSFETKSTVALAGQKKLNGRAALLIGKTRLHQNQEDQPLVAFEEMTVSDMVASKENQITAKQLLLRNLEANIVGRLPIALRTPEIAASNLRSKTGTDFAADAVTVGTIRAVGRINNEEIASLQQLEIERPQYSPDHGLNAAGVNMAQTVLLPAQEDGSTKSVARFASGRISAPGWSEAEGLTIQEIILADLRLLLIRDQDGELQLNKQLAKAQSQADPAEKAAAAADTDSTGRQTAGQIDIKTVRVQGESNLRFEDRALAEPYIEDVGIQRLEVTDLSSRRPERPASVNLQALLAQRAPLEIKGSVKPFLSDPEASGTLVLKNYPLARLSPYTIQSVGLAMASGQLNLNSKLEVGQQSIAMKNGVLLKKLETKTISQERAKQLDNQLPLPLDTAISFLKDSNGDINLAIPISGPLSKLDVGISDILITALSKAIIPAASSYLLYTLGPYGALAYVGMKAGEKIMHASLAPVIFQPQQEKLTPEHIAYLDRVAKIMQERPKMEINLCPTVPTWEFDSKQSKKKDGEGETTLDEKTQQQMIQLGQERAKTIISHLVSSHGIDQGRLLICETAIKTESTAVPEVDLQL